MKAIKLFRKEKFKELEAEIQKKSKKTKQLEKKFKIFRKKK